MAISYSGADASLYTKNVSQDKAIAINRNDITSINEGGVDLYLRSDVDDTAAGFLELPLIGTQRVSNVASGISWYNRDTYKAWSTYMSPAGQTNTGPTGDITAPAGSLVTSWGLRNYIENSANFGWTWESGTSAQTTPTVVAEIRSSDGAMRLGGALTVAGNITSAGNTVWTSGNDGAGSGLDADLLDGVNSTSFLRSNVSDDSSGGTTRFFSPTGGLISTIGQTIGLQCYQPTASTDAFMTFHVGGDFAAHFGLDGTTNDLAFGGWSMGAVKNKVWHAGNDGSGSGLDADLLDGVQGSSYWTTSTAQLTTAGNALGQPKAMYNGTGASIANNVTTSSASMRFVSWNATVVHTSTGITGTWRNITGRAVAANHVGTFVKIS